MSIQGHVADLDDVSAVVRRVADSIRHDPLEPQELESWGRLIGEVATALNVAADYGAALHRARGGGVIRRRVS